MASGSLSYYSRPGDEQIAGRLDMLSMSELGRGRAGVLLLSLSREAMEATGFAARFGVTKMMSSSSDARRLESHPLPPHSPVSGHPSHAGIPRIG